jgi:hypothetical protein
VIDEFAARFVYFYTGYILARQVFAFTARAQAQPWLALGLIALWGVINGAAVFAGYATLAFASLALGLVGAAAVATVSSLMAMHDVFRPLRYCGRNSIVIYLAFFLPMAARATAQDRMDRRRRHHVGDHHHRRRARLARAVLGGARQPGQVPVRTTGAILAGSKACAQAEADAAAGGIARRPQARIGGLIMRG